MISLRAPLLCVLALASVAAVGCAPGAEDDAESSQAAVTEDPNRPPQIVRVVVRFTRNDVSDVGYAFSDSWLPFTGVRREELDGYFWGYQDSSTAKRFTDALRPDGLGAGYASAIFRFEIPWSTTKEPAFGLTRVKLEREFVNTEIVAKYGRHWSALRIRSGSEQPCMSVTMSGALQGKLRAVEVPFADETFTEREWNVGDRDGTGRPIKKVAVGSLQFGAYCWPENVEGKTHVSGGAAIPGSPVFAMVDKSSGQGGGDSGIVHVNLVQNDVGLVSVGAVFSTNAGILNEREQKQFDSAVGAAQAKFAAGVERGRRAALEARDVTGL